MIMKYIKYRTMRKHGYDYKRILDTKTLWRH